MVAKCDRVDFIFATSFSGLLLIRVRTSGAITVADLHSEILDTCPGQFFKFFMQFSGIGWCFPLGLAPLPPVWEILDPSLDYMDVFLSLPLVDY